MARKGTEEARKFCKQYNWALTSTRKALLDAAEEWGRQQEVQLPMSSVLELSLSRMFGDKFKGLYEAAKKRHVEEEKADKA